MSHHTVRPQTQVENISPRSPAVFLDRMLISDKQWLGNIAVGVYSMVAITQAGTELLGDLLERKRQTINTEG